MHESVHLRQHRLPLFASQGFVQTLQRDRDDLFMMDILAVAFASDIKP